MTDQLDERRAQPRPVQGVFVLLDVPLGGAALVLEPHHPVGLHEQVGDDEAYTGEQRARRPFDPGADPAGLAPALPLIPEILVEPLDPGLQRTAYRGGQPM